MFHVPLIVYLFSVADPERIFSDPDPTFKDVSAPDPDPVSDPS